MRKESARVLNESSRMRMVWMSAGALIFSLLAFSLRLSPANAYSFSDNRGLMPLGELEAFMANTGIALSGSTGAVAFNPAGLAGFKSSRISLSANTYMKWQAELTPLQTIDGTDLDFSTMGIQAIPHSFVSTWRAEPWTYAFSIVVPHQIKLEDVVSYSSPSYPTIQLSRTNFFQVLMGGLSVATRYGDHYDVGAGCFYTMYQTAQMISFTGNTNGAQNAFVSNAFFRADVTGVLCNGGIQKQVNERLRIGVSAQMPFIPLTKSGRASAFVQNPIHGVSVSEGPKSVSAEFKMPLDVGVGMEYRLSPLWRLYLDVNRQMADQYYTGDLYEAEVNNKATTRFNGGMSYHVSESLQLFGGLAYNPSASIEGDNTYAEDFVVGTLGANWTKGSSSFGVGLMGARSSGSKDVAVYDASFDQIGSKRGGVRTDAFGVLVSSGYLF